VLGFLLTIASRLTHVFLLALDANLGGVRTSQLGCVERQGLVEGDSRLLQHDLGAVEIYVLASLAVDLKISEIVGPTELVRLLIPAVRDLRLTSQLGGYGPYPRVIKP
jgi:hypothetical protein